MTGSDRQSGYEVLSIDDGPDVIDDGDPCERCGSCRLAGEGSWLVEYAHGGIKDVCSSCASELEPGAIDDPGCERVLTDGGPEQPGKEQSEDEYTVGEHRINIEADLGRPEVFVETSPKETLPSTRVNLLRDSDAVELHEKLGEYLRGQDLIGGDSEDELPIRCEWEVGVQKRGDPDSWQFFHPRAKSESEARRRARSEARDQGWTEPEVYQITGPWRPNDPTQVGREIIEEVFDR